MGTEIFTLKKISHETKKMGEEMKDKYEGGGNKNAMKQGVSLFLRLFHVILYLSIQQNSFHIIFEKTLLLFQIPKQRTMC